MSPAPYDGGEQPKDPATSAPSEAGITVDGTGLLCVTLLLRLRKQIDGVQPGTVVHVIATDPAAPLDLAAWCHLTGHTYLGPVACEGPAGRYAFKVSGTAVSTHPASPWRLPDNPPPPGARKD